MPSNLTNVIKNSLSEQNKYCKYISILRSILHISFVFKYNLVLKDRDKTAAEVVSQLKCFFFQFRHILLPIGCRILPSFFSLETSGTPTNIICLFGYCKSSLTIRKY